jgi:hypothetical protein
MLLITNYLVLRVVAGSRTLAGRQHAVSGRPMLIHTYYAVPMLFPCRHPATALRGRFQKGIFVARQGNGTVYVNQTRPYCVNQMGKTRSPSQSSEGVDSREAQVYIPLSVSHSCVDRIAGLINRHLNSNWGICLR